MGGIRVGASGKHDVTCCTENAAYFHSDGSNGFTVNAQSVGTLHGSNLHELVVGNNRWHTAGNHVPRNFCSGLRMMKRGALKCLNADFLLIAG